jgi:pimeloyl-ACP methyl ester carboxylesterase
MSAAPGKPDKPLRPPRRWRRRVALLLLAYVVVLLLIAVGCADRLILYPSTYPLDTTGLTRHDIGLPGGGVVEAWSARSAGATPIRANRDAHGGGGNDGEPRAFVLAFVGNAARAEPTATYFAQDWGDHPVEVWAVNYPGYGGSPGSARLANLGPTALAAYDALRARAGDKPIILEARSIGTAAALHVAAHRPVAGCVLHNPPPLRQLILGRFGWWNLWLLAGPVAMTVPAELDSPANAARAPAPGVLVMAGADGVVPPAYQQVVADAYAGEKRLVRVPGAGHNDRVAGAALVEYDVALDWVWAQAVGEGR